jgi:hypothetical protein
VIWNERNIATAISRQVLDRKCVVLVDNCLWTGYECDVLGVTTDLRVIDIEIKISRADLKADAGKDKWWHRIPGSYDWKTRSYPPGSSTVRVWPPKVWKHYYAMPLDIWKPELLDAMPSPASGVILMKNLARHDEPFNAFAKVARRAHPNRDASRLTAEQVMDIARLANLRMWNAYEAVAKVAA